MVVLHTGRGRIGEVAPRPYRLCRAGAAARGRARVLLARDPQALVAHEVEQNHGARVAIAPRRHARHRQPAPQEVVVAFSRRLLAVEEHELDRVAGTRKSSVRAG